MKCTFGQDAYNGDYVLVVHHGGKYGSDVSHFIGMVHNDKIYTGVKLGGKYIHKLSALVKIPEGDVPEEIISAIRKDMFESTKIKRTAPDVIKAFSECKTAEDINKVCTYLNVHCAEEYGRYGYFVRLTDPVKFTVIATESPYFRGKELGYELPFCTRDFTFAK